jgi:hypothetical protein
MSDDLTLAPIDQTALSVVTFTSVPNGLDAWSKRTEEGLKGRVYVALTVAYFTPIFGATLTICKNLLDLINKVSEFINQKVYNQNPLSVVEANQKRKTKIKGKREAKSYPIITSKFYSQTGSKRKKSAPRYSLSKLARGSMDKTAKPAVSLAKAKKPDATAPYSTKTMVLDSATIAAAATEYGEPLAAKKGEAKGKAQTEPAVKESNENAGVVNPTANTQKKNNYFNFTPPPLDRHLSALDIALGNTTPLPNTHFK